MNHIQKQYAELVALTKLLLLTEYSSQKSLPTTPDVYRALQPIPDSVPASKVIPRPAATVAAKTPPPPAAAPTTTPLRQMPVPPQQQQQAPQKPNNTVTPPPPKEPVSQQQQNTPLFTLNPLGSPLSTDFKEIKQLLEKHVPGYEIIDHIPSDQAAQHINTAWQYTQATPSVLILSFHDNEKELTFLHNIARAISICLTPAEVISAHKTEQNKGWETLLKSQTLHLIISNDDGIYTLPELKKHLKEHQRDGKLFLDRVPLLLLPDLSIYLKEPKLKAALWQAILTTLKNQHTRT